MERRTVGPQPEMQTEEWRGRPRAPPEGRTWPKGDRYREVVLTSVLPGVGEGVTEERKERFNHAQWWDRCNAGHDVRNQNFAELGKNRQQMTGSGQHATRGQGRSYWQLDGTCPCPLGLDLVQEGLDAMGRGTGGPRLLLGPPIFPGHKCGLPYHERRRPHFRVLA